MFLYLGGEMKQLCLLCALLLVLPLTAEAFHVLVFVPNAYGANSNLNREMYDRLGFEVTIAGVTSTVQPCSGGMPTLTVDVLIDDIPSAGPYDCIAIWSCRWWNANPYSDLIASQHAIELVQQANAAGKILWCTCAGLRVFAAADIINGVQVQGRPGNNNEFLQEYLDAGAIYLGQSLPPVIDGNIVTTMRGQNYYQPNIEAILTAYRALHAGGEE